MSWCVVRRASLRVFLVNTKDKGTKLAETSVYRMAEYVAKCALTCL